jgi:hypothetical protein
MKRHEVVLALFPSFLLVVVAALTFFLVIKDDFSIWYGGGFGMFASLDGPSTRYVLISASTGNTEYELDLNNDVFGKYENDVRKITVFPRKTFIESLLRKLCLHENLSATSLTARLAKMAYTPSTQRVSTFITREVRVDCT